MDGKWILLGVFAWVLGVLFVIVLMRMAGDQDRAARRAEKSMRQSPSVERVKGRFVASAGDGHPPPGTRSELAADATVKER